MKKITDVKIINEFGIPSRTLSKWKSPTNTRNRIYKGLKELLKLRGRFESMPLELTQAVESAAVHGTGFLEITPTGINYIPNDRIILKGEENDVKGQ